MSELPKDLRLWRQNEVCRVVNKYNSDFDVNIQRGTIWGNPFGDDPDPVGKHRQHFIEQVKMGVITKAHLEVLRGMRLGCTCKPKACHGDIIAAVVNRIFKDEFRIEDL